MSKKANPTRKPAKRAKRTAKPKTPAEEQQGIPIRGAIAVIIRPNEQGGESLDVQLTNLSETEAPTLLALAKKQIEDKLGV